MSTHSHCGGLLTAIETVEARLAQLKATATEAHALSADDAPDGSAAKLSMASSALQEVHSSLKTDCIELDRLALLVSMLARQPSSSPQALSAPQASAGFGSGGAFGSAGFGPPSEPRSGFGSSFGRPSDSSSTVPTSQTAGGNPFLAQTAAPAVVAPSATFTPSPKVDFMVPCETRPQRDAAAIVAPYSVTLNQANIVGNNNKFYILQIVSVPPAESTEAGEGGEPKIGFFTRWGRVGEPGQFAWHFPVTEPDAVRMFEKKFEDKTKQPFASLMDGSFQPQPQRYSVILV